MKKLGRRPIDADTRFWAKVNKQGPLPEGLEALGPCWVWTASLLNTGYGSFSVGPRAAGTIAAHAYAWQRLVAPVPVGFQLDHICRNRACCNPNHLSVVTARINVLRGEGPTARNARKTFCLRGHEFTPENTRILPNGGRACRECLRQRRRDFRQTPEGREQHRVEENRRHQRGRAVLPPE